MMVPLLQVALMLEVVVVDTVDRLYSFLDGLRARPWTPGADPAADAALLPDLAGLSRRADVRDAVLVKVVSPSMSQAAFRTVACRSEAGPDRDRRTADAYALVDEVIAKAWENPGYDARRVMQTAYHQDVPKLLDRLAARIPTLAEQSGLRAVTAYASWLQGDDLPVFKGYLDSLRAADPSDEWAAQLGRAFESHEYPAWLRADLDERERLGAVTASTADVLDGRPDQAAAAR